MGGYYYDGMGYDTYQPTGVGGSGATPPVNTVAPAVTGTATVGQTLTTDDGTWTGTATIVYTYQWQRAGVNIGSATANTYLLVDADYGSAIRCVVTGTNGAGNASANSNATAAVVRTYLQEVAADSPSGFWRLGEASGSALDTSGGGHDLSAVGTLTRHVTDLRSGGTDGACTFDGSSAHFGPAGGAFPDLSAGDVTAEAWVKTGSTTAAHYWLMIGVSGLGLSFGTNGTAWIFVTTGKELYTFGTAVVATATTYHVTMVWNLAAKRVDLYINGSFVNSQTGTQAPSATVGATIGAQANPGNFWNGEIDDLAVYPSALSAGRITAHYGARAL